MEKAEVKKLGLVALISGIVTSSLGSGVFNVSSTLAQGSTVGVSILAWLFVMIGIGALAWVFATLSNLFPNLTGVTDYALEGGGKISAVASGFAYFVSGFCGNLAFLLMLGQAISYFSIYVPALAPLANGSSIETIIFVSAFSWILTWFVIKYGVENMVNFNTIITFFKVGSLVAFMLFGIIFFQAGLFTAHFWESFANNMGTLSFGQMTTESFYNQFSTGILSMIFLFVGIESASMMGDRAQKKSDVAKATMIATFILFFMYFVITMLPFGMMSQQELANIQEPALVFVVQQTIGPLGGALMSIALIIALVGALISWFLLPVEPLQRLSSQNIFPKWMGTTNEIGAPVNSLIFTQVLMQMLIMTLFFTDSAYIFALSLCTVAIVISYFFVGLFQLQVGIKRKSPALIIPGLIVVVFEIIAVAVSGIQYLALCSFILIMGFAFYVQHQGTANIKRGEWITIALTTVATIATIIALVNGSITLS